MLPSTFAANRHRLPPAHRAAAGADPADEPTARRHPHHVRRLRAVGEEPETARQPTSTSHGRPVSDRCRGSRQVGPG